MSIVLFILNPGSTSTKTALFRDQECLFEETIRHQLDELPAESVMAQLPFRLAAIVDALNRSLAASGLTTADLSAIVGRGGLLRGVAGGTYLVSKAMLADLEIARYGEHASNLGAFIAEDIALRFGLSAYIVDPPSVDEMADVARYTGLPGFRRQSIFHALNQKAVARLIASDLGKPYDQLNLIVAHLGGGISVGAHQAGRVIDVNNALQEGPFSPDRAGTLPTRQLADYCLEGPKDRKSVYRMLVGEGGLFAYTGSTDFRTIENLSASRSDYLELIEAMAYQIAKEIGAMAAVLSSRVDAVILTGGLAHSKLLTGLITDRVRGFGPVKIHPGEDELAALANGVIRVLEGSEKFKTYDSINLDQIEGRRTDNAEKS